MKMNKAELVYDFLKIFRVLDGNVIPGNIALQGCEGLILFSDPLFGFSSAHDKIFTSFKRTKVIGEEFMMPEEWLSEAETVISFFLPFSDKVKESNRNEPKSISPEWLHARIEGQNLLDRYSMALGKYFEDKGIKVCIPSIDERFSCSKTMLPEGDPEGMHFASTWSERHAAFASGIGTFGLSKGLITSKGVAGRIGSLIVSEFIEPDRRPYEGIYDYCIKCGRCIGRCPVKAIDLKQGKNQKTCNKWIDNTRKIYTPRYGCGKCQVGVPCESGIPLAF